MSSASIRACHAAHDGAAPVRHRFQWLADVHGHRNIVAALQVEGAQDEMFGAAAQKDKLLRVKPTDHGCDARFYFDSNGDVHGLDNDASDTVDTGM
jgi:hypothetical protein